MTFHQISKSIFLSRDLNLNPDCEFEPVDLGSRKRKPRDTLDAGGDDLTFEQILQRQAEKKKEMENQFSVIELEFMKRSFYLDLKQRKAFQGKVACLLLAANQICLPCMTPDLLENLSDSRAFTKAWS